MDKLYLNDAKYDRTEVTQLRLVKQGLEIFVFFLSICAISHLLSFFLYFSQRGQCDSLFRSVF